MTTTCLYPKKVPIPGFRKQIGLEMAGEGLIGPIPRIAANVDELRNAWQWTECRQCLDCLQKRRNQVSDRVMYEADRTDRQGIHAFLTLTYKPSALPHTKYRRPGEYTQSQQTLLDDWEKFPPHKDDETEWNRRGKLKAKMDSRESRLAKPTIEKAHIRKLKKAFRQHFGWSPMMVVACEFGTEDGRPHYHAMIYGQDTETLDWLNSYWDRRFGHVDFGFLAEGAAKYFAKDIAKQRDDRQMAIALGTEAPGLIYPQKPMLAHRQVDDILSAYRRYYAIEGNTVDFWFKVHGDKLGRVYRVGPHEIPFWHKAREQALKRFHEEIGAEDFSDKEKRIEDRAKLEVQLGRAMETLVIDRDSSIFDEALHRKVYENREHKRKRAIRRQETYDRKKKTRIIEI